MSHLSTPEKPWGKPYTNKRYLHPPFAENIVTLWPNSMVMISEIVEAAKIEWKKLDPFGSGFVYDVPSSAVMFTLKRDSDLLFRQRESPLYNKFSWSHDLLPSNETKHRVRRDGVPIHSQSMDLGAFIFLQEVFCDTERVSTSYIKVTLKNKFGLEQKAELGVLVRTGPEFLLTGCPDPDGYAGYNPKRAYIDSDYMTRFKMCDGYLTDGTYRLYYDRSFSFDGENDLNISLSLGPYESCSFEFVFTRNASLPIPYAKAKKKTESFWKNELSLAKNIPNKNNIKPLFYNILAQQLQMFACPKGKDYTVIRQGALQRYHWPEAKETVKSLSLIGGYTRYIEACLSHYFGDMQEKEGENKGRIYDKNVPWNSRTSAALEMFEDAVSDNTAFYDRYIENALEAFSWMEAERSKSEHIEGAVKGLFPPGIATDNHFPDAQQWTFADVGMIRGYQALIRVLTSFESEHLPKVKAAYDNYFGTMRTIFEDIANRQSESEFLYLPRDPKGIPELENTLNKDPFYYMFPNEALSIGLAGFGTKEAEKIIHTYSYGGQSERGLVFPVYRSTTGTGRTWYTSWSEHSRYIYYMRSGNREKCKELLDAVLAYNVTTEYYQCERYDDHNAYIAPWLPNASANGRLLFMLFDYYGKKSTKI